MLTQIKRLYKIVRIRLKKRNVKFQEGANFSIRTEFEGNNVIGRNSWLDGKIGYCSYIGNDSLIEGAIGSSSCFCINKSVFLFYDGTEWKSVY